MVGYMAPNSLFSSVDEFTQGLLTITDEAGKVILKR